VDVGFRKPARRASGRAVFHEGLSGKRLAGPAEARCPVGDARTPLVAGRRPDDLGSPRLRCPWLLLSVRKVAAAENERAENGREIEWHLGLRGITSTPPSI
jgi:hypothetical protein